MTDVLPLGGGRGTQSGRRRIALFDFSACVSVYFQPDGDLDDDRGLPLHGRFLDLRSLVLRLPFP
jgi:hypothetical protein